MSSLQSLFLTWFSFVLLIAVSGMALWAFYFWWKKDRHTRERFAFFGFSALLGFSSYYIGNFWLNTSIIDGLIRISLKPFGVDMPLEQLTPIEAVLFLGIFGSLLYAYIQVFKHWNGQKSLAQYEQEQNRETASVLTAILLLLRRDEKLTPYQERTKQHHAMLEKSESLAWHERARQLWLLRNRAYMFKDEDEYDPARKCWLGEEKYTGALVFLACHHDAPSDSEIHELAQYARKVADARKQKHIEIELILALKNGEVGYTEKPEGYTLRYTSEAELLKDLVDFSDYFDDIRYRVERAKLVDSDFALQDTYTPSFYRLEKDGETQENILEEFVLNWLKDNTRRQIALIGEYGQGKSTTSLLLSYNLIKQAKTDPTTRIPILIELRGKTLRTLSPEELLATWAYRYRIEAQVLLHLHMAGRLLLIFEGFDEIDLSGDTEARLSHFSSLWRLNYEHAKIIMTGRPNFFLDSKELKRALGNEEQTQTLYLAPFSIAQITDSLRSVDIQTSKEIVALAGQDLKFYEVVARPSLLYIVAILWQREHLSQREHINSALVIDLFIRQTLRRQQDKHAERPFMALNSAERRYFMAGVAAYMAAKGLPNQIDNQQLDEAVHLLVAAIPDSVSQSVSSVDNEVSRPLKSEARFDWKNRRDEIMHKINTDVRSCGLIVTDFSKDGTFKFAHKSYMEFLQAQVINQLFAADELERVSGRSIANTWKLRIANLQNSDEAFGFLAELLKERMHEQGLAEKGTVVKGLLDILVFGKLSARYRPSSFFNCCLILPTNFLTNQLIGRFGVEKRKVLSHLLFVGISSFVPALVLTFGYAGTFVGAFGIPFSNALIAASSGAGITCGLVSVYSETTSVVTRILLAFAGIATVMFIVKSLVQNFSWLLYDALFLTVLNATVGLLLGLFTGLAIDLMFFQKGSIFKRFCLWYRACLELRLQPKNIEKTVGRGMVALLAEAEESRRNKTNASGWAEEREP